MLGCEAVYAIRKERLISTLMSSIQETVKDFKKTPGSPWKEFHTGLNLISNKLSKNFQYSHLKKKFHLQSSTRHSPKMSHRNPTHGQKVKSSDPADTIQESTGTILSDSLAAESLEQGGEDSFAGGHATASKQSAKGTNTNNYDTSSATTLNAAPDAEARMATEEWSENAALKAGRGLSSSDDDGSYSRSSGTSAFESTGSSEPTSSYEDLPQSKPHGRNLQEGGFDDSAPNASFNQDIGGKNDPGRLAEQKFSEDNARNAAAAGFQGGREESEVSGFDTLNEESA
jgi:hypothetical protein